ncbi:unnamed protein product [Adineta steineri]|uniref:G-protein coupled receptors family 1 profile domain-containing protein n=1 Tax=Adineta steineri TaxID=433720 RepID=A0A814Y1J0_9BILA|nr:unnamed protein product [Adineta steineri]CAF1160505.1 unnamed protein product [Adineta steineri]CAF1222978.1 unnamed protein product [Adineta steineri]
MRRYSTFCYLACLALVDLGVIITFCVNFISLYHFHYDIQDESFPCKLFAFSTYFLPQYSSWILVAVSIDRVISAKYLRLAKTWSKPRHSVFVTLILGLFLAVLNSHFFLYDNNSIKQRNQQQTETRNQQQRILNNNSIIERYLSNESFTHQPSSFLIMNNFSNAEGIGGSGVAVTVGTGSGGTGNDSSLSYEAFTSVPSQTVNQETTLQGQYDNILTNIKQDSIPFFDVNVIQCSLENSIKHGNLYVYWVWIDLAMNVFIPFTAMIACTVLIILTLVRSSSRAGSTSARRSRRRRNISVMLITVNLVFISLTAPIVIFLSVYEYVKDDANLYRQTILVLIKIFCIILMNLNHSINIVIYSITAKEFRSEMANFLQALLYCIIGKPLNPADLPYMHDDGTLLSRLRHLRRNLFKCCQIKMRSHSPNTTDTSGLQHTTTAAGGTSQSRSSNSNKRSKRQRSERNGKQKYSMTYNSETSTNKNNSRRLIVQLQADPISSVYEREDVSFHGLSISTED